MPDESSRHENYEDLVYARLQIRDCVKGSNSIKRGQEMYLPMPSGMLLIPPSVSSSQQNKSGLSLRQMPWWHENPAYRAYLHRARFPDVTGAVLRGILGIVTKEDPVFNLSSAVANLEDLATTCGKSLVELFGYSIGEVMQTGKICYVLDVNSVGKFQIAVYSAERNVDWEHEITDGVKVLTKAVFTEKVGTDVDDEMTIEYRIENGIAVYERYVNGNSLEDETVITLRGKTLDRLPVFFCGAMDNSPMTDVIPLLGISDIALTAYRKDADLAQAQYMTCNPTLFIFGVSQEEAPKMIGSTVTVTVSNPNAKAEYPSTDTSALNHVRESISALYDEAVTMGSQILGSGKKSAESAEALSLREASSGATLVSIVGLTSKAISDMLNFASEWAGSGEVEFDGSLDFADHNLSPQGLSALVSSWMQNAVSHDTLLDNLRDANIVSGDVTNDQEKSKIITEQEAMINVISNQEGDGDESDK